MTKEIDRTNEGRRIEITSIGVCPSLLRLGDKGTYIFYIPQYHIHFIKFDNGNFNSLVEGYDKFKFIT